MDANAKDRPYTAILICHLQKQENESKNERKIQKKKKKKWKQCKKLVPEHNHLLFLFP